MNNNQKQELYLAYVPANKPGQSLSHYTCSGATRGYVSLRRRDAMTEQKPQRAAAPIHSGYNSATCDA